MITTENIHFLYNEYFKNLKDENLLEDYSVRSINKEEWVRRMRERSIKQRELFVANEALLNQYFFPLVNHEQELTDELVTAIAKEIFPLFVNSNDYILINQAAALIEPYAEAHSMLLEHIISLLTLGQVYQLLGLEDDVYKAHQYYCKLDKYRNRTKEMPPEILTSFLTGIVWQAASLGNMEASKWSDIVRLLKDNVDYLLNNQDIINYYVLDKKRIDPYFRIKKFALYALIAKMIRTYDATGIESDIADAFDYLKPIYDEIVRSADAPYKVDIQYSFLYYKLRWLKGEFSFEYFFEHALMFYEKVYNTPEAVEYTKNFVFQQQNNTQVYLTYVPNLLECYSKVEGSHSQFTKYHETVENMVKSLIEFLPHIPNGYSTIHMCEQVHDALKQTLPLIDPVEYDIFDIVYSYVIKRDRDVSVHSYMVAKLSVAILNMVKETRPELLIGCLDTGSVEEVLARFDDIREYIYKGSLLHDIGKIPLSFLTEKHTRKLSDEEFEHIKRHPSIGGKIVALNSALSAYSPLVEGHHKNFDDSGYPADYSYLAHENAVLVNIVKLSDCLDAATDCIGRSYNIGKSSDDVISEFINARPGIYNSEIVDIIASNKDYRRLLSDMTTSGRIDVCYEIFEKFLD